MSTSQTSDLAAVEQFARNNPELDLLEAELSRFNVFSAMGLEHAEIRHSRFLAWLLDPAETHRLGDLFVKAVIRDLLVRDSAEQRPVDPHELDRQSLTVEVRREWKYIDLLIVVREPRLVLAFENKLLSREHSDQLRRYEDTIQEAFPGWPTRWIYLTLNGDEPSSPQWQPYTFADLHRVLRNTVDSSTFSAAPDVKTFIHHYLMLLDRIAMTHSELDDLCYAIYKKHGKAIETICKRVEARCYEIIGDIERLVRNDGRFILSGSITTGSKPRVWFTTNELAEVLPPNSNDDKIPPTHWVYFEFRSTDQYIKSCTWCAPTRDKKLRRTVLDHICGEEAGFGFKEVTGESFVALEKHWLPKFELGLTQAELEDCCRRELDGISERNEDLTNAVRAALRDVDD